MALIEGENRDYLTKRFSEELTSPVTIEFFTRGEYLLDPTGGSDDENEYGISQGEACRTATQLLTEIGEIAGQNFQIAIHDTDTPEGQQAAQAAGVNPEMLPALSYSSANLKGHSRYYGLPSGYEFGSMIDNLTGTSKGEIELSQKTQDKLARLSGPVNIMVFVTPT